MKTGDFTNSGSKAKGFYLSRAIEIANFSATALYLQWQGQLAAVN
jgi:hypothetical protein